jgi:hypothetical protein
MVVHGLDPDISQLLLPRINTAAHPPGPGFRMAEPSVKIWNVLFIANLRWKCRRGIGRNNLDMMAIEG